MPRWLDDIVTQIHDNEPHQALQNLIVFLRSKKLSSAPSEWSSIVEEARRHPLMEIVQQDPFTSRCFQKPNGYPGDATLLDLIYSVDNPIWSPVGLTPQAQNIFDWTIRHASPRAVRCRRRYIARLVDEIAGANKDPRILTIAGGHLREAELSVTLLRGQPVTWISTDQDEQSLATTRNDYGKFGIVTDTLPIMSLLREKATKKYDPFNLVYAAGLYDYLNHKTGSRLLRIMFDMVSPGGTVLITNFAEAIPDVGYMECYMDWHLIYRSVDDMYDLIDSIPEQSIARVKLFTDPTETLYYLQLIKS